MVLGYTAGSGIPVSYAWTGTLLPFQHLTHTFQAPYTVLAGEVPVRAFAIAGGDGNASNDTATMIFTGLPLINVPYSDNFDGQGFWVASGGLKQWERGTPGGNTINTPYSPPFVWMTNLNANYLNNSADYLYSPFFNFSQVSGAVLRFRNNFDTQLNNDAGMIQYSIDGGVNWSMLGYISAPGSTNWYTSNIGGTHCWSGSSGGWIESSFDLTQFDNSNDPVQFRFYFMSNASTNNYDGWAIDDFSISLPPIASDAGILRIMEPTSQPPAGTPFSPKVRIKNYGSAPLTSIPLEYTLNNGTPVQGLWTGNLAPQDSTEFTFSNPSSPTSSFNLCVETKLTGDIYTYNNKVCRSFSTDVGVTYFFSPLTYALAGDSTVVKVRVDNFGSEPVTSFDIYYQVNMMNSLKETWTGTLNGGESVDYTFSNKYVSPFAMYQICAFTSLPGDNNVFNDKLCRYTTGTLDLAERESVSFLLKQNRPNPSIGLTEIPFVLPGAGEVVFDLTDLQGRSVYREVRQCRGGENSIQLSTDGLAAGTYLYSLRYKGLSKSMMMTIAAD
jgi:hypothetical protein